MVGALKFTETINYRWTFPAHTSGALVRSSVYCGNVAAFWPAVNCVGQKTSQACYHSKQPGVTSLTWKKNSCGNEREGCHIQTLYKILQTRQIERKKALLSLMYDICINSVNFKGKLKSYPSTRECSTLHSVCSPLRCLLSFLCRLKGARLGLSRAQGPYLAFPEEHPSSSQESLNNALDPARIFHTYLS